MGLDQTYCCVFPYIQKFNFNIVFEIVIAIQTASVT